MGKGIYSLVLSGGGAPVRIGALGELFFPGGYYVYIGSALGPGGLPARVGRHIRTALTSGPKTHWHIDYLLRDPSFRLLAVYCAETKERMECNVAGTVGGEGTVKFGCSDCRCSSHLFFFPHYPGPEIVQALGKLGLIWNKRTL
jgi:Uri superfamily endonuclease